ncbi:MAG TPA: hypothetical protein VGN52_03570 [Burkholderiales bacterium]
MSANYRQHQLERDLACRVASLEARVAWLEDVLTRVLGQPAANQAPAEPTPLPAIGAPDRFMLRTQPLSALRLETDGMLAPPASANDAPPAAGGLTLAAFTLADGEELPAAIARGPDGAFSADYFIPAPAPTPAPAPPAGLNLGITAAFETLEGKVAQAADAELVSVRKRGPAAPAIVIRPELMQAPPAPRRIEGLCALELLNPSILQQVSSAWGTAACMPRLLRLIGEDCGGRMGLDPQVREELQLLAAIGGARP